MIFTAKREGSPALLVSYSCAAKLALLLPLTPPRLPPPAPSMDPDAEVGFDFSPFLIRYKSGRVSRLMGTARGDAGSELLPVDPSRWTWI